MNYITYIFNYSLHQNYPLTTILVASIFVFMSYSTFLRIIPMLLLSWRMPDLIDEGWKFTYLFGTTLYFFIFGSLSHFLSLLFIPYVFIIIIITDFLFIILSLYIKKDKIISISDVRLEWGSSGRFPKMNIKLKNKLLENFLFNWIKTMSLISYGVFFLVIAIILIFNK